MVDAIKLPNPHASSIEEAQALIRRCAEPRPAGDPVKAAIRRASLQLQMRFARVKAIWYGEARRIDSEEMDRLRRGVERAELAHAVAAIEFLTNKALASPSPASHQMISNLHAALLAFSPNTPESCPSQFETKSNFEQRTSKAQSRERGRSGRGLASIECLYA